ncbi:MAG: formylglycine-generating enzyme family protein [Planctomycetaceae bacterium]|nr:formylglycine-generating enzyme family protein [Planctomycetaceae bacterium]
MKYLIACLFIAVSASSAWAQTLDRVSSVRGIASKKPASGFAVQISEDRWMVSYRETIADGLSFLMVPIPGGTTTVGSPQDELGRRADEGPQAKVTLKPFWMAATEVSWNEYKMFQSLEKQFKNGLRETEKIDLAERLNAPDAISVPTALYDVSFVNEFGDDSFPAVSMSHFAAMQYTKWLTLTTKNQYRLPTEVEWEHACRAGSTGRYSCGNDESALPKYARYSRSETDAEAGPLSVGSLEPNAWGLHDMHGNVAEWVIDQYMTNAWDELPRRTNARGPAANYGRYIHPRVYKGGSWMDFADCVRSAVRFASTSELNEYDPEVPYSAHWLASEAARGIGFRVVRSLEPEPPEVIARFWNPVPEQAEDLEERIKGGRNTIGVLRSEDTAGGRQTTE